MSMPDDDEEEDNPSGLARGEPRSVSGSAPPALPGYMSADVTASLPFLNHNPISQVL